PAVPSSQRRRKRSGLLEFRPNLLAADIDLPSTRPILPLRSGRKFGNRGSRARPAAVMIRPHKSCSTRWRSGSFPRPAHTARCEGFGRTWGGDGVQTTLLGVAVAIILALVTALVGPLFIDWNSYRGEFETRASRLTGLEFRVTGAIDARLLPTPTLVLEGI